MFFAEAKLIFFHHRVFESFLMELSFLNANHCLTGYEKLKKKNLHSLKKKTGFKRNLVP